MARKYNLLICVVLLSTVLSSCGACSHTGRKAEFERRNRSIQVDDDDNQDDEESDDQYIDDNDYDNSTESTED